MSLIFVLTISEVIIVSIVTFLILNKRINTEHHRYDKYFVITIVALGLWSLCLYLTNFIVPKELFLTFTLLGSIFPLISNTAQIFFLAKLISRGKDDYSYVPRVIFNISLIGFYVISASQVLALFFRSLGIITESKGQYQLAPMFYVIFAYFTFNTLVFLYLWIQGYRHAKRGLLKSQLELICIGWFLSNLFGFIFTLIMPALGDGSLAKYGSLWSSAFIIAGVYSVTTHGLFNIKIISSELFIGFIGSILFVVMVNSPNKAALLLHTTILGTFIIFGVLLMRELLLSIAREKQLKYVNRDLKELIQAKDNFLRMTSHQLRTPLTVVNGYLSMLADKTEKRYQLNTTAYEDFVRTYISSQNLLGIVNDLLLANAITSGRFELAIQKNIDLDSIIHDLIQSKDHLFEEYHTKVSYNTEGQPLKLDGDTTKLREALSNLIDNGVFYGKGMLDINVSKKPELLSISIRDNGIGINQEDVERIWHKFIRGSRSAQVHPNGSGLGLYLAKKIIESHKGTIEVKSEGTDKGSEFIIQLAKHIKI